MIKFFLFTFLTLIISNACYSQKNDNNLIEENPDDYAQFKGGNSALFKFIQENTYNDTLLYDGISKLYSEVNSIGRVFMKLTIDKNGKIIDATILKGLSPKIDKLSLKIALSMPNWIPAKKNNISVNSYFTFAIKFSDEENFDEIKLKKEKCSLSFHDVYDLFQNPNSRREKLLGYSIREEGNRYYYKYFTCNTTVSDISNDLEFANNKERITSISFNKDSQETIYTVYDSLTYVSFSNQIITKFKKSEIQNNIEWYSNNKNSIGIEKVYRKLTLFEKQNLINSFTIKNELGEIKDKTEQQFLEEIKNSKKLFYYRFIFKNL